MGLLTRHFLPLLSKSGHFPVWKGSSTQTEMIKFSNGICLENEKRKIWKPCASLDKRFQQPPSMSVDMFLETLIRDSRVSSFWFEEGVGPLKDMAYECFWKRITGQKKNIQSFAFSTPEFVDCFFVSSQEKADFSSYTCSVSAGRSLGLLLGIGLLERKWSQE